MKGLLCAVMIGTHCVKYLPAGTTSRDIYTYVVGLIAKHDYSSATEYLYLIGWGSQEHPEPSMPDSFDMPIVAAIKKHPTWHCKDRQEACAYFAVTKKQRAEWVERERRGALLPIERFNEDQEKP